MIDHLMHELMIAVKVTERRLAHRHGHAHESALADATPRAASAATGSGPERAEEQA
jgi:hypothetical protein